MTVLVVVAFIFLAGAAGCFLFRLFRGPFVADRIIALDGLLMTVTCGIMVEVTREDSITSLDTVLVVALVAFVATGVLARYVERRADESEGN